MRLCDELQRCASLVGSQLTGNLSVKDLSDFPSNIPLSTSFILPAGPCAGGDHAKQLLFNPNRALLPSGRYNSETIQ